MAYCPSHGWDDHVKGEDDAAAARVEFYTKNRELLAHMAARIFASVPLADREDMHRECVSKAVSSAADILLRIDSEGEAGYL